jgi:hypothetical protein
MYVYTGDNSAFLLNPLYVSTGLVVNQVRLIGSQCYMHIKNNKAHYNQQLI